MPIGRTESVLWPQCSKLQWEACPNDPRGELQSNAYTTTESGINKLSYYGITILRLDWLHQNI